MTNDPKSPFQDHSFDESLTNNQHSFDGSDSTLPSPLPTPNLNVKLSLRFNLPKNRLSEEEEVVQSPFLDEVEFERDMMASQTDLEQNSPGALQRDDTVMKRHRWGTTRNKQGRPKKNHEMSRSKTLKRLLNPNHKRKDPEDPEIDVSEHDLEVQSTPTPILLANRSIVFNRSLPPKFIDQETGKPNTDYPRNKIRTTKYTPLSFIPKNLSYQFLHNIANIFFLVMVILGAFDIFGVPSPILAAVPLIVIVIITAVKDAIEDSRRTVSDMEVNNQVTHILTQLDQLQNAGVYTYENQNIFDKKISLWRRFKKWNTRQMFKLVDTVTSIFDKEKRARLAREKMNPTQPRKSFESEYGSPRPSTDNPFDSQQQLQQDLRASTDFRRSVESRRNHREKTLKFTRKYWKDVRVGDILRIYNNDEIPADVIILATSDEDNCCYVETKNLDGETNLKVRQALKHTSVETKIKRADDLIHQSFQIDSEGPNPNLYSYQANLKHFDDNGQQGEEPITINNILLRGCSLRNTKWVIGIVSFTGDDTKIMLNAGVTPTKQSRMSKELNYYVLLNFILLFILCFTSGIINGFWYRESGTSRDFYEFGTIASTPALNGLVNFFVALILYQSLVPISLYITIEIIKTAQAYFIYSDAAMYYEKLDYPCTPKSWSISDDLGQIEYVFSDKTGTLTQNLMEFKKCTINGVSYGRAYTEALAGLRKRQGIDVDEEAARERELIVQDKIQMIAELNKISPGNAVYNDEVSFVSSDFIHDLNGARGEGQREANSHFMMALALCHSVLVEDDPKNPGKMLIKAQSPDEAALVGTARSLGYNFIASTKKGVIVDKQGVAKEHQILNTLEFNSTRKRMSAIIKIPGDKEGEYKALLICKGADSIIYERLSKTQNDQRLLDATSEQLEEFAVEGLRTLCIAQRTLTWDEYEEWNKRHNIAASSLENREEKMEAVADSIERELILLGGTAIEDRLQDGVPDTISILNQAGIKLWVLTGDKVETAINIGFSCNLLGNEMELLLLKTKYNDEEIDLYNIQNYATASPSQLINQMITSYLDRYFQMAGSVEELDNAIGDHSPPNEKFGIVIDGDALKLALEDDDTRRKFLLLCKQCRSVLCCRVSPAQKAAVVKLVKDTLDVMTLAIGDGSNDVAMIQAADIGVGIAGEEGRQAAMSSDYAIGQFRYLAKLLLAHGRWSYKRFSEMIPLFFYKNVIYTVALYWYGVYNDFDGSYLFEFTYLMFYNLAFTSLPIIFLGVFDQDVSAKVSLLVPQIYRTGILRTEWTQVKFWWYMVDAIYQSVISFFFPYLMYYITFPNANGLPLDHRFLVGIYVTTIACIACNLNVLVHQYRWDWLSVLIVTLSILLIFIWTGLWTVTTYSAEFYKAAPQVFGTLTFWVCSLVGILICLIPRFFYDFVQKLYWPKDIDIIRECVKLGNFDAYPEDYDPTDPNKVKISQYGSEVEKRISMVGSRKSISMKSHHKKSASITPTKKSLSSNTQQETYKRSSSSGSTNLELEERIDQNSDQNSTNSDDKSRLNFSYNNNSNENENNEFEEVEISQSPKKDQNKHKSYDNSSVLDMYKHINHTREDLNSVQTEEIAMEDFNVNRNKARRISSEINRNSDQFEFTN